jgi:hypothetical protein
MLGDLNASLHYLHNVAYRRDPRKVSTADPFTYNVKRIGDFNTLDSFLNHGLYISTYKNFVFIVNIFIEKKFKSEKFEGILQIDYILGVRKA